MIDKNKLKKMTLIALVDIGASLFYFGYLIQEFRITLSVITLPVLLYIYRELKPLPTVVYVGIISILGRSFFMTLSGYTFLEAFNGSYPEMGFYILYGMIYQYFYNRYKGLDYTTWFAAIVSCDFLGNMAEIMTRALITGNFEPLKDTLTLLLIAVIRGGIAFMIILAMHYYRLLLKRKEHEERYRRLVAFSSEMESEIYYMNMNLDFVEKVMSNSYNLYEKLAKEENLKEEAQVALNIAKEVHEVKKNYIGVIEGMEDIMGKRIEQRSMNLKDIVEILKNIMYAYINKNDLDIQLDFIIREDVKIQKHYYIMSILRNLLMNGLESIGEGKGNVEMTFEKLDNFGVFKVKDTGRGIKDKNLGYIFHPGFSTKFKEGSGDIKRGIGLTLVKDIVEKEFKGKITVSSDEKFTEFKVVIPLVGGEII